MTCSKWQFLLATAEACELEDNVALHQHLADCAACAQFAREMQAVSRAVRSLPRLAPSSDFGARVRRDIEGPPAKPLGPARNCAVPGPPLASLTRVLTWH